jgi:hypothetical protein
MIGRREAGARAFVLGRLCSIAVARPPNASPDPALSSSRLVFLFTNNDRSIMYDTGAAFPAFNLIAIVLMVLPSWWHIKSRNVNTLMFIFWEFISVLMCAINSLIYYDTVEIDHPVWCDVSNKFRIGLCWLFGF